MLVNAGQTLTERAKISGRMEALIDVASGERCDFRELNARANRLGRSNGLRRKRREPCLLREHRRGRSVGCLLPGPAAGLVRGVRQLPGSLGRKG